MPVKAFIYDPVAQIDAKMGDRYNPVQITPRVEFVQEDGTVIRVEAQPDGSISVHNPAKTIRDSLVVFPYCSNEVRIYASDRTLERPMTMKKE